MVTVLKHRLALAVLVGVLVIPLFSVNNGGLSHLLFCEAAVAQPFAFSTEEVTGGAQATSSQSVTRDEPDTVFEGATEVTEVCEGVRAEVTAQPLDSGRVSLTVSIVNDSELPWRGSISLAARGDANSADLTAAIGEVPPGERGSATVELRIPEGQTEIGGTLLLGP